MLQQRLVMMRFLSLFLFVGTLGCGGGEPVPLSAAALRSQSKS
jgi:hypothetical protein